MCCQKLLNNKLTAILISFFLTLVVAIESIYLPTAPFFIVYALLVLCIPLASKQLHFGSLREAFCNNWRYVAIVFTIAFFSDVLFIGVIWDEVAAALGHKKDVYWSLNVALDALLAKSGGALGIGKDNAQALFAAYFLFWAPIAEELFYRGYLFQVLRLNNSFWPAALISGGFFGIRHATHLLYLLPAFPLVAAIVWVADAFVIGIAYAYLYEKTRSLWPPFLVHLSVNLIGIVLSAVAA